MIDTLIQGAYDLHIHCAPDVLPRKVGDIEMAQRIVTSGMAGYCMKSHYFCTAERASLIREWYPNCHAVGALCLNSSVGGLNPAAVELAARAGARIIWMPTCDSAYERKHIFSGQAAKLPFWAQIVQDMEREGVANPTIFLLDDNERLRSSVHEILEIVARHNLLLATGHISHKETFALVKAAKERGVRNIAVTHADFPSTFYTVEEQRQLVSLGACIEHCYTTYATGKVDFSVTAAQIRAIGVEHVFISTDLGQQTGVFPDEGMLAFANKLYESGFTSEEIITMNNRNPRKLIGVNADET